MNLHSRTVLIPLPRPLLPSATVVVPGPGPIEPGVRHSGDDSELTVSLPIPPKGAQDEVAEGTEDAGSEQDRNDADNYSPQGTSDPYANLGGAFGSYLVDAPHPMNAAGSNLRSDDLLL